MKDNLFGYSLKRLQEKMVSMGEKPFKAIQLYQWIYERHVFDFDSWSDVSKKFREVLNERFCLTLPKIFKKQVSLDGTIKLLLEMEDGAKVETVLMRYDYGNAVCVSSEVGCSMGCAFCASGLIKKTRNLTAAEMVGQVMMINGILEEEGQRATHIVVMGTGEPFDNYDNVMEFIRIMNEPHGLAIGARHITVSTCGLVEGIRKYAEEGLQINLAISLHAPNQEIRSRLMPIARKYDLNELMDAVKYYEKTAGRRVTFEYILIEGINDGVEQADELSDLIRGTLAYANLIVYNAVKEKPFKRPSENRVSAFYDRLKKRGVNCTIRKEFGGDIDAACGQLRAKYEKAGEIK